MPEGPESQDYPLRISVYLWRPAWTSNKIDMWAVCMIFGISKQQAGHTGHNTHTHIHFSWPGGRLQVWSLLCLSAAGRSFFVMSLSMGGEDGLTPKLVWLQQDQLNLLTQNSAYPWKVFPSFFLGKKWLGDITWGKDICSLASCSLQRAWSAKKCGVQLLFFDFKEVSNIKFAALLLFIIWNFL